MSELASERACVRACVCVEERDKRGVREFVPYIVMFVYMLL